MPCISKPFMPENSCSVPPYLVRRTRRPFPELVQRAPNGAWRGSCQGQPYKPAMALTDCPFAIRPAVYQMSTGQRSSASCDILGSNCVKIPGGQDIRWAACDDTNWATRCMRLIRSTCGLQYQLQSAEKSAFLCALPPGTQGPFTRS